MQAPDSSNIAIGSPVYNTVSAVSVLTPASGYPFNGYVNFTNTLGGLQVHLHAENIPPNTQKALHIHNLGDVSTPTASALSIHYNPDGNPHGCPALAPGSNTYTYSNQSHAGDFGNVQSDANGVIDFTWVSPQLQISDPTKPYYILGRGISLHNGVDSCTGSANTTGSAGDKGAQGVIGFTSGPTNFVANADQKQPFDSVIAYLNTTKVVGAVILSSNANNAIQVSGLQANTKYTLAAVPYVTTCDGGDAALSISFTTDSAGAYSAVLPTGKFGSVNALAGRGLAILDGTNGCIAVTAFGVRGPVFVPAISATANCALNVAAQAGDLSALAPVEVGAKAVYGVNKTVAVNYEVVNGGQSVQFQSGSAFCTPISAAWNTVVADKCTLTVGYSMWDPCFTKSTNQFSGKVAFSTYNAKDTFTNEVKLTFIFSGDALKTNTSTGGIAGVTPSSCKVSTDCAALPNGSNTCKAGDAYTGMVCVPQCNTGFTLSDDKKTCAPKTCNEDKDCSALPNGSNLCKTGNGYTGKMCVPACNTGFTLSDDKKTCNPKLPPPPNPSCNSDSDCPKLTDGSNTCTSTPAYAGKTCVPACNAGFTLSDDKKTCKPNVVPPPNKNCKTATDCPPLTNGSYECKADPAMAYNKDAYANTVCVPSCKGGFTLSADKTACNPTEAPQPQVNFNIVNKNYDADTGSLTFSVIPDNAIVQLVTDLATPIAATTSYKASYLPGTSSPNSFNYKSTLTCTKGKTFSAVLGGTATLCNYGLSGKECQSPATTIPNYNDVKDKLTRQQQFTVTLTITENCDAQIDITSNVVSAVIVDSTGAATLSNNAPWTLILNSPFLQRGGYYIKVLTGTIAADYGAALPLAASCLKLINTTPGTTNYGLKPAPISTNSYQDAKEIKCDAAANSVQFLIPNSYTQVNYAFNFDLEFDTAAFAKRDDAAVGPLTGSVTAVATVDGSLGSGALRTLAGAAAMLAGLAVVF